MQLVLGVDGGNTKTIALVARTDGTILGWGRGGCTDICNAPTPEAAMAELSAAVDGALKMAGAGATQVASASFCMAGADWPEDYAYLRKAVAERGYGRARAVHNDAIGALRAGTEDGVGVVLACGTGVATGARNAEGEVWHSSFWQEAMGAQEIGLQALRLVFRAALGIDPPTAMARPFLDRFGCTDEDALLRRLYGPGAVWPEPTAISRLAPLVLDAAEAGDAAARGVAADHGRKLGEYGRVAARKVGLDLADATVVLNGGIFRHKGRVLRAALADELREAGRIVVSPLDPAYGALMLAIEQAGTTISAAVRDRIIATAPPSDHFSTKLA